MCDMRFVIVVLIINIKQMWLSISVHRYESSIILFISLLNYIVYLLDYTKGENGTVCFAAGLVCGFASGDELEVGRGDVVPDIGRSTMLLFNFFTGLRCD
jgi:hypothetical protein